jgi:hypothetical protein
MTGRQPARPAPPRIPVAGVRPGAVIGGWKVLRDGLTVKGGHRGVRVACTQCGRGRITPRQVLADGRVRDCKHRPKRADLVLEWITANAPDRAVTRAEVAAGAEGLTATAAGYYLSLLTLDGWLARPWPGQYALPGVEVPPPPDVPARARVTAFLAADDGGTFAEIRRATGIDSQNLAGMLATLARHGRVVRQDDTARGGFYLLPGQEPGEVRVPGPA